MWYGALVVAAWGCAVAATDCDVTVGDRSYSKEILATGYEKPSGLAVDHAKSILYFNFFNGSKYGNAKINLNSKEVAVIKELRGQCQLVVGQAGGKVYAGCKTDDGETGGLWQLNSETDQFELAGEAGKDIQFVHYFNETLYYSFSPEDSLRTFSNGQSVLQPGLTSEVWDLVVAARGDIVFENYTGVYRRRENSAEDTQYVDFDDSVSVLAVDGSSTAYGCNLFIPQGIWRLHDNAPTATKLLDVQCTGLAFDAGNNIIYGDFHSNSIVRLVQC